MAKIIMLIDGWRSTCACSDQVCTRKPPFGLPSMWLCPWPSGVVRPYVVWEVGTGTVLVDSGFAARVWGTKDTKLYTSIEPTSPEAVRHMADLMAHGLFKHLATALPQVAATAAQQPPMQHALSLLGPALSVAVAGAFAAAPPLWFCIVCPAVLGLLAPLAINIALNQVRCNL